MEDRCTADSPAAGHSSLWCVLCAKPMCGVTREYHHQSGEAWIGSLINCINEKMLGVAWPHVESGYNFYGSWENKAGKGG